MSLDAVLALVIFIAGASRGQAAPLFVLFYILSPAIRSGSEWAQLFYFDLKRLEAVPFGNLGSWLARRVYLLSWVVGPLFWAIASLAAAVVLRKPFAELAWPLLPFFHSRSLLAAVQVRAFTEGAYGKLTANGLLALVGYLIVGTLLREPRAVLGLAGVNYLAVLLLSRQEGRAAFVARRREPVAPATWLKEIGALQEPLRICGLRYCPGDWDGSSFADRQVAQAKARGLARELALKLGRGQAVTVVHPGRILWCELAEAKSQAPLAWLITRGAGLFETIGMTDLHSTGAAALREARKRGFFGEDLRQAQPAKARPTRDRVESAFRALFPAGIVWAPGSPADRLKDLLPKQSQTVVADAAAFARDFHPNGRRSGFEVTAFCDGSDLQLVFVVERHGSFRDRLHWRSLIRQINLDLVMSPSGDPNCQIRIPKSEFEKPSPTPAHALSETLSHA